jgi:hypothetical protein
MKNSVAGILILVFLMGAVAPAACLVICEFDAKISIAQINTCTHRILVAAQGNNMPCIGEGTVDSFPAMTVVFINQEDIGLLESLVIRSFDHPPQNTTVSS